MRIARAATVLVGFAAVAGCLRSTQFECQTNDQCGAGGICQPVGFCSVTDSSCAGSMQRFGDAAGSLSNTCVQGDGGIDAGVDGPPLDAIDAPGSGCPADYITLPNTPLDHRYKLIANGAQWSAASDDCVSMSQGSTYLAIPDDAAELSGHATQIATRHWVGINDLQTEGTFVNVKGMPQTFLPFGAGEPDDTMGGQDCVSAINGTNIATDKCNTSLPYLCECED